MIVRVQNAIFSFPSPSAVSPPPSSSRSSFLKTKASPSSSPSDSIHSYALSKRSLPTNRINGVNGFNGFNGSNDSSKVQFFHFKPQFLEALTPCYSQSVQSSGSFDNRSALEFFDVGATTYYKSPQTNSMSQQQRPSMHARDSSGKQVSLLNDEPSRSHDIQFTNPDYSGYAYGSTGMVRSTSNASAPSVASSPCTPSLMRADSYDSQNTNDPHSPITPTYLDDFGRQIPHTSGVKYKDPAHYDHHDTMTYGYSQHPQYSISGPPAYPQSRATSHTEPQVYEDEQHTGCKGTKRYPCRFKDSHGCDRTFTTSGHASRHSKIHTAEKAVQCTFTGCLKKFTRADNMKQHLETHFKDRSRSITSSSMPPSSKSSLTFSAGVKKAVRAPSRASSRAESRPGQTPEHLPMDPALFEPYLPSNPTAYQTLNMRSVQEALVSQPMAHGLDALAAAAAQSQE